MDITASWMSENLTQREQKFVQYYLTETTAAEAARKAGYLGKYPHTQAWRVLQRDRVKVAIKIEQQRLACELDLTADKVVKMMLNSYQASSDKGDAMGMLKAAKEIGMICGFYRLID